MKNKNPTRLISISLILIIIIITFIWILCKAHPDGHSPGNSGINTPSIPGAKIQGTTIPETSGTLQPGNVKDIGKKTSFPSKKIYKLIDEAEQDYLDSKWEECIKKFKEIEVIAGNEETASKYYVYTRLGAAYINMAESEYSLPYAKEAEKYFLIAIRNNSDDMLARIDLARVYILIAKKKQDKKYLKMAEEELERVERISKRIDPKDSTNLRAMVKETRRIHLNLNPLR